ncbi:all trans-polyprenyl-diphosphate synthase PDSS2-like [Physella acuta]|uniref:all trans-polyprenyl-diphosphate synthase PDSS2-like n=1 Tax=Physella acuta TaxID=109671 RepID=UPI0027DD79FE|nr:all trans-polyprenyl-diphosphate synthase PDSS2-like [Physella acuta]
MSCLLPRLFVSSSKLQGVLSKHKLKTIVSCDHFLLQQFQCGSNVHYRGYMGFSLGDTNVSKAVSDAEKIVGYPTSFLSLRCLLSDELSNIALHMRKLVGTKHPLLKTARGMVFDGKNNLQLRGLLIMLISKAAGPNPSALHTEHEMISGVYPSQRSLAEITEVIYTANLIHKGVVNLNELLPDDGPFADMEFGNKMAVLSGDYLLASACSGLAKLGFPIVVEKVASCIADMMSAEFTEYTDSNGKPNMPKSCLGFSDWLIQTHLSLGSLLAKSCQSAMILAGHSKSFEDSAYAFGENTIYAQQMSKDIVSITQKDELSNFSLTSAPVFLYKEIAPAQDFTHLETLWHGGAANYKMITTILLKSGVVDQCIERCQQYRAQAIAALDCFQHSDAKSALINVVNAVSSLR